MPSTVTAPPDVSTPVAPWWHTVLVLLILLAGSAAGAHFHGLPRFRVAGLSPKDAGYLVTLAMEWLLVLLIWLALRARGLSLHDLISGRWHKATSFLKDLGWAVLFLVVATPCLALLSRLLPANFDAKAILPSSAPQLVLWLLLAATAGFSEELTFRGYLNRQFSAWSGSRVAGLLLQGLVFGLAHGVPGLADDDHHYGLRLDVWRLGAVAQKPVARHARALDSGLRRRDRRLPRAPLSVTERYLTRFVPGKPQGRSRYPEPS